MPFVVFFTFETHRPDTEQDIFCLKRLAVDPTAAGNLPSVNGAEAFWVVAAILQLIFPTRFRVDSKHSNRLSPILDGLSAIGKLTSGLLVDRPESLSDPRVGHR
jgi:hypothetical protein